MRTIDHSALVDPEALLRHAYVMTAFTEDKSDADVVVVPLEDLMRQYDYHVQAYGISVGSHTIGVVTAHPQNTGLRIITGRVEDAPSTLPVHVSEPLTEGHPYITSNAAKNLVERLRDIPMMVQEVPDITLPGNTVEYIHPEVER